MELARIRCHSCGRSWDVLWRDIDNDDANICPHCGATIDRQIWDKDVKGALAYCVGCNVELAKDSEQWKSPMFSVSFITRKKGRIDERASEDS